MNILFLVFHGFNPANGISKKISYQIDALRELGHEVHLCHFLVRQRMATRHVGWMICLYVNMGTD